MCTLPDANVDGSFWDWDLLFYCPNGLFKEWQSVGPRPQLSHDSDYPMLLSVQCFAQLPIRFRKLVT